MKKEDIDRINELARKAKTVGLTPEARAVSCDAAFLPVGGTYTMTAAEAAALANALHPQIAVPTHYGSIVGAMTDGDDFAAQLAPGIRCVKLI